jgi:hypothetical protein
MGESMNNDTKHLIGEIVTRDIANYVTDMGSGQHESRKIIRYMIPHDELFLGCLYPLKESEENPDENEEMAVSDSEKNSELGGKGNDDLLSTLRKPSSISVNFCSKNKGQIKITPKFSVYLRVIPNDEDYKEYIKSNYGTSDDKDFKVQEFIDENVGKNQTIEHPMIWKRYDITLPITQFNLSSLKNQKKIVKEFSSKDFLKIHHNEKLFITPNVNMNIDLLKTDGIGVKTGFWDKADNKPDIELNDLNWKVELSINDGGILPGLEKESAHLITITFVNKTDFSDKQKFEFREIFEPVIFNSVLKCELNDVKIEKIDQKWDYELPYSKEVTNDKIPEPFEINFPIDVWGNGCFPKYYQDKNLILTKITITEDMVRDKPVDVEHLPSLKFSLLSNDSDSVIIQNLKEIEKHLEDFHRIYEGDFNNNKAQYDKKQFDLILKRFKEGIDLIISNKDPNVIKAFRHMNKTYQYAYGTEKDNEGWRLFQLIFIIGNLKRTLYSKKSNQNEDAELLFVATGGGKTESYVGLTICLLFYERLTNKEFGIATWVKFPLRLLALDQFDRLSSIITWAEKVRNENNIKGFPFSLGFFVGNDEQFPAMVSEWVQNRMGGPNNNTVFKKNEGKGLEHGGLLKECPICKKFKNFHKIGDKEIAGDYRWKYLPKKHRVKHWCEDCKTEFYLHITDEEIYRFLPSILVSTVDKLASGAWNPYFSGLLGSTLYFCEEHGFSVTPKNCSIMDKRCGNKNSEAFGDISSNNSFNRLARPFDRRQPFNKHACSRQGVTENGGEDKTFIKIESHEHSPTLIVQDELHLLKENLGTIDSYFEGLVDSIIFKNSGRHPKFIAMSATLAGTRKQVGLLYLRGTTLWPGDAPSKNILDRPENDAFFKHQSNLHRLYVGIMPHGKTPDFACYRSLQYSWMRIHDLINDIEPIKNRIEDSSKITDNDIKNFLNEYYQKSFVYQGRKIGTHNFASSIDRIVNKDLQRSKYCQINCDAVTGDNSMEEIREYRSKMDIKGDLDSLISTSLISHGVDISNVNQMFFQGIPDLTAEFIQASSRIGRKFPGIVFVSFYPSRSRDLQLSSSFNMYIKTIKYWVESVPIARWCKEAMKEIFSTAICFGLCNYGQQLLGSELQIERSWPITIHQLGNPNPDDRKPGYLTWRIKDEELDSKLKKLLKEGLALEPSDFIKSQTPPDLLPKKVITELEEDFESLYNRFITEIIGKVQRNVPSRYSEGQLAYFLKDRLGSSKNESGHKNAEYVENWFNCMTGLRGIQEPVEIFPSPHSMSYLRGGE